jgi:hypothetical protein
MQAIDLPCVTPEKLSANFKPASAACQQFRPITADF